MFRIRLWSSCVSMHLSARLAAVLVVVLVADPGGARDVVLDDPASALYYNNAVTAGESILLVDVQVEGDLHSNGEIKLQNRTHVVGNAAAVGRVGGRGTVSGERLDGAEPIDLPVLDEATRDALRALADRVFDGDTTLEEDIDDIVFVDGDVRLASLRGGGAVIATGDIRVESGPDADLDSFLSLIAFDDLDLPKERAFRGVLRAGRDIRVDKSARLDGVLLAGRKVHLKKDTTVTFLSPDFDAPAILPLTPEDGAVLADDSPLITATFSDELSGIDFDGILLRVAGIDRTGEAAITATDLGGALTWRPSDPLVDGLYEIELEVRDRAGNLAVAFWSFTVALIDETPPMLAITAPTGTIGDPLPTIVLTYTDVGRGIDPATLAVELNGVPINSGCSVGAAQATCGVPARLVAQSHAITASIADLAGNRTSVSGTFELVDPPEPEDPPVVSIAVPADGELVASSTIAISGAVLGADVSVTVNGQAVDLVGETWTGDVSLSEGANLLSVTATNPFDSDTAQVEVVLDATPPTVLFDGPSEGELTVGEAIEVHGTATDLFGIDEILLDGEPITLDASGAFTTTAELLPGPNTLEISAVDAAGNQTLATVTVERGAVPGIALLSPVAGLVLRSGEVEVTGTYSSFLDDETAVSLPEDPVVVRVSGGAESVEAELGAARTFRAVVPLAAGSNTLTATAENRFGSTSAEVTVERVTRPEVTIISPAAMTRTAASTVQVSGTVSDPSASVRVISGAASVAATVTPGGVGQPAAFTASLPLAEGADTLIARATATDGEVGSASLPIVLDSRPPRLVVETPRGGDLVGEASVAVRGAVLDLAGSEGLRVTVSGSAFPAASATVQGGAFVLQGAALAPGENVLTVTAEDAVGNLSTATLTVVRSGAPGGLRRISGDGQSGVVASELAAPLVVELRDALGRPVVGAGVFFRVTRNDGVLDGGGLRGRTVEVATDAQGRAAARWTLGGRAGAGSQEVEVSTVGDPRHAIFTADALPGPAAAIHLDNGNAQTGLVGETLAGPLVVVVTDAKNNRLSGVPVVFELREGGGSLRGMDGGSSAERVVAVSGGDGMAGAFFTLGAGPGVEAHQVTAAFDGGDPAVLFKATGVLPGDPALTSVAGVVLDPVGEPLGNVRVALHGADLGAPITGRTNADGQFELVGVPVGHLHLGIDGSTVERPGVWSSLEYRINTLPGHTATVGAPIHILPLDIDLGVAIDETTGGVLTLEDLPGFALDIAPGSVTFPGGSKSGVVSVTAVHADKVPMTPNFAQQPRLIVTIQPAGAVFDPPARLTLPNLEGLAPGEGAEMYSFDHDQGRFVSIGQGFVSMDGLSLVSAPGFGVVEAGWHCGGNPQPSGDCCDCKAECKKCSGGRCVNRDGAKPSKPPCVSRSTGTERSMGEDLIKKAFSSLPWITELKVEASVSGEVCPICCGGAPLMPGTLNVGGSVTGSAVVEKVLSPVDAELDKKVKILGYEVGVKVDVELGPKVAAEPSLTIGISGSRNFCDDTGCITFQGCASSVFRVGASAVFTIEITIDDFVIEEGVSAEAFGQTNGVTQVKHFIGSGCPGKGTVTRSCIGDLTGNVVVTAFGFSETYKHTFAKGTAEPCECQ